MLFRVFIALCFVLVPSWAFAWGPLTHMYLGSEILALGAAVPAAVASLIRRFRSDFLYGNMMADSVLAKKHLPFEDHPHNWDVALGLLGEAGSDHERAFCMGYLSHLAADTVAHGVFTSGYGNLGHTLVELRADTFMENAHWSRAVSIDRDVQRRNDRFLSSRLKTAFFSHRTNRGIFKGYIAFSALGLAGRSIKRLAGLKGEMFRSMGSKKTLDDLHRDSLDRIASLLSDTEGSPVLGLDPIGNLKPGRILKAFRG